MARKEASLVRPSRRYQSSYISAVHEYIKENREPSWHPDILRDRFDEYLQVVRQAETEPLAGMVPATQYWLILIRLGISVNWRCVIASMKACCAMAVISATRSVHRSVLKDSAS